MGKCRKCGKPEVGNSGLCMFHRVNGNEPVKTLARAQQAMDARYPPLSGPRPTDVLPHYFASKCLAEESTTAFVAQQQKEVLKQIRVQWKSQISAIVVQVKALRHQNPGVVGINAGANAGIGNTQGGTNNPLTLTVPANDYKITSAEIFAGMNNIDSSDSGDIKYREFIGDENILVHLTVKH